MRHGGVGAVDNDEFFSVRENIGNRFPILGAAGEEDDGVLGASGTSLSATVAWANLIAPVAHCLEEELFPRVRSRLERSHPQPAQALFHPARYRGIRSHRLSLAEHSVKGS